jgi:replicative DNA helicase
MSELGKIPPQAPDLEEAVLGSLMLDGSALANVADFLRPEMFYKPAHQTIYKTIIELDKAFEPTDILTVTNKLGQKGELKNIGGAYAITQLTSRVGSAGNIEYHARIIQEKFMQREVIRICSEGVTQAFESEDIFTLFNNIMGELDNVSSVSKNDLSSGTRMGATLEYIQKAMNNATGLGGVSTGYATLDEYMGGLIPGDLIVCGGLPGAFKTALMLSICHNVARRNVPVLMFEQEMSQEQTGLRELSRESQIPINRLKVGNISQTEYDQLGVAASKIEQRPVYIDITSGIDMGYIRTVSRKMIKEHGVGLIVVDYLQLMDDGGAKKREDQVLDATVKQLKVLAKQLKVPVILLSALNDNAYRDPTEPPKANSLKGSRAIGAHADIVILLWNPARDVPGFVYQAGNMQLEMDGKLGIIFNKNRQGDTGLRCLGVIPATNTFMDL